MSVATNPSAAGQTRRWTRRATVVAGALLSLLMARDAAAACQGGSSTLAVSSGQDLASIISNSSSPCTLNVAPGVYTAPTTFLISSNITIKSTGGPSTTFLQVPFGQFFAVVIEAITGRCPSGATLDGFTLSGGYWGIFAQLNQSGVCASNQVTGITLRNLVINTNPSSGSPGHGIYFDNIQNSVIDSCTITDAYVNGIFLGNASNNNIVMNNTIQHTVTQHAIVLQGSNDNAIVGNTVNGSAYHGILLNSLNGPSLAGAPGASRNRVERNTIVHHMFDGVSINDASNSNYVGLNTAVSDSYNPISKPSPSPAFGVGIWVNNGSNGNYLFGNDLSGSPENGIDVTISKNTYMQANKVHGNLHGGIWMSNNLFLGDTNLSPTPFDMVVHSNHVFFNTINANLHFEGVTRADVAYNHVAGDDASGTLPGTNTIALFIHEDSTRPPTVASSGINVYENTITDVNNRAIVYPSTTGSVFFRNKFLRGSNNPAATDGRAGLTYSFNPAAVSWDGNSFLGGNHWSDLAGVSGNPDPAHPYRGFLYGGANGIDGLSQYVDRYPYSSEHLGAPWATYSVSTVEPVAGAVLAAGTTKTIRWIARGCVYVNLWYGAGSPTSLVAYRHPNIGHYFWTVPAAAPGTNYVMRVDCLNSAAAAVGAFGDSAAFTIATNDLVLMNPGRAFRAVNGSNLRVAWKKSAAVGNVNIFVKSGSGGETAFGPFTGTWADITLPGTVSDSSRVTIRIQDASVGTRQDSVDGYFMVRGTAPAFFNLTGQSFQIGSIQVLQWAGRSDSYLVDLDLYNGGVFVRSIVRNLPDFGNFTWLVPDNGSSNSQIRATFKNELGTVVGSTLVSGTFTMSSPPIITLQPADQIVRTGFSATFTVGASPAPTFQWQVSIGGGSFNDLSNNAIYSGVTTATLTVSNASAGLSGNRYRAVATSAGSVNSNSAMLTVADFANSPGDSDGDGKGDLIWRSLATGDVAVWLMNGATITSAPIVAPGVPLGWQIVGIGDLDGDGKADLVWRHSVAGDVSVWLMNGTTIRSGPVVAAGVPLAWQVVGVGDLDGDGKADLVWRNNATGDVAVWLMNGATVLQGPVIAPGMPLAWQIVNVGDLDGDGKADLVWRNNATGDVSAWLMNGTTVTNAPVVAAGVPLTWTIGGVGDLDGDGKADLIWRNNATGDVAAWLMNGVVIREGPVVAPGLPLAWQVSVLRDLDGDGKADIVFRNTTTGDVAVWLMNGVVIGQAPIVATGLPLAWQIQR